MLNRPEELNGQVLSSLTDFLLIPEIDPTDALFFLNVSVELLDGNRLISLEQRCLEACESYSDPHIWFSTGQTGDLSRGFSALSESLKNKVFERVLWGKKKFYSGGN